VLERVINANETAGRRWSPAARDGESLDAATLATFLIGGILKKDLQLPQQSSLLWQHLDDEDFILTPLPNHLFQRDNSCWVYGGRVDQPDGHAGPQARDRALAGDLPAPPDVRRRRRSPSTTATTTTSRAGHDRGRRRHVIGNGAVMVGMGERTTPHGIEALATRWFAGRADHRVIAVELPKTHAFMHLDTAMTMVDRDTFVTYPYLDPELRSWTITPDDSPDGLASSRTTTCGRTVAEALEVDKVRSRADEDVRAAEREQWDDGTNFLAVAPGVVVGYERNVTTNTMLRKHGIEVVTVAAASSAAAAAAAVHDLPDRARPRPRGLTMAP
jgi:arginine deiminase